MPPYSQSSCLGDKDARAINIAPNSGSPNIQRCTASVRPAASFRCAQSNCSSFVLDISTCKRFSSYSDNYNRATIPSKRESSHHARTRLQGTRQALEERIACRQHKHAASSSNSSVGVRRLVSYPLRLLLGRLCSLQAISTPRQTAALQHKITVVRR